MDVLLNTIIGNILMRGSWPPPFLLLFCIRAVDEKGDVHAGILLCGHCAGRWKTLDGRTTGDLKGRNIGRKLERFIVTACEAQLGLRC